MTKQSKKLEGKPGANNAGCDRCGTNDRMKGSKYCAACQNDLEYSASGKSRHGWTPGPWRVEQGSHNDLDVFNILGPGGCLIAEVPNYDGGTTSEDDAALIAAAPELLEALESIVGTSGFVASEENHQKALIAIAKARGRK